MAVYEYTARDENGNKFNGTYSDVGSIAMLREEMSRMGDTLLKARCRKPQAKRYAKINQTEVVTFAYRFAAMYSAGLPIIKSLKTIEEQTENPSFKRVISNIRQSVATGSSLKDAFEKHRNIFSNFFLGMVEAGESSGKLSETLEMSARYLEKRIDFKQKLKSAFVYPVVVGIISLAIVTVLVIFVVPVFSKFYKQINVSLPGPTQILINLSVLIRYWWWMILLLFTGVVLLLRLISKKPHLKAIWDAFKLKMPVFAKLNQTIVVFQFIRTFAVLVSAGVSLIKALDVASFVVHNSKVTEIATQLQQSIRAGNPIAESLRNYEIFPAMVVQFADSGEESGTLSEMLNKGADFLEKDIDRTIKVMLVKIEPAVTVIMGLFIGFILMAIYLPMVDYMKYVR